MSTMEMIGVAVAIAIFGILQIRNLLAEVRRYEEAVLLAIPEHGRWIFGRQIVDFVRIRMPRADPWKVYAALNRLEEKGTLEVDPYEEGTEKVLDADAYGRWRTRVLMLYDTVPS